ncbi:hypothetical protein ERO13_D13G229750v2 [Gossypium hirsutum]|uniref:Glycosyltransferase n=1 Tax=Gossypium hirsutum TaxID=3635 RepID=A0A1U8I843_GOSHI|nr:UDP-glycosyltransferase 71K1-like [Gossypium hirsutum]KAG4113543.1 hypothetical protein ERO13_D13G229750v2 [Gossypium hirsutum]
MKKAELIFVPQTSKGHLIPILEFAKRLIDHDDWISITVAFVKSPSDSFTDAYIESVKTSKLDRFEFIDVSQQEHHSLVVDHHSQSIKDHVDALMETHMPLLKDFVTEISSSRSRSDLDTFTGLVFDLLLVPLVDIAHQFNIPSYIFLTANAGFLSLLFHLTTQHDDTWNSPDFKRSYPDELSSGFINPVPFNVLPSALFDKDNGYPWFMMTAQKFKAVKGIMVNTFEELEPYAISGFSDRGSPPVYPVGPVLDINCKPYTELDLAQCKKVMKWLDEQPRSSVIFLCFGSFGHFLAPQVKEIALGLEQSGYRFLWSLRVQSLSPRQPSRNDGSGCVHYIEDMLPEGFMERIQGKGIMIHGWAPQVKILAHEEIGGFVSHCGWNSILESLWFGVPVVTWPMYAEQQLNAFKMKELGLAIELRLDYEELNASNVMTANEIKKAVKQVMDDGSEVRKKAKEMAEIARKAIVNGGSSFLSIQRFIEDMIGEN